MVAMQENHYTSTVYNLIKDGRYSAAVEHLEPIRQALPSNRAALSLLGMCFYQLGHYESACQAYETLTRHHHVPVYRLYHAQSLYKAGELDEASRALEAVAGFPDEVDQLRMAIAYALDQTQECRAMLRATRSQSGAYAQNEGCILYKEGKYREAQAKFEHAIELLGASAPLLYSIALCNYKLNKPGEALKYLARVVEMGVDAHPELSIGIGASEGERLSVGNTRTLQETAFVEAFNLKAAIEFALDNTAAAKEALADMPPRDLGELDACTLHNRALLHMADDPGEGFRTLSFLVANPPFPPETFRNLLLLYITPPHAMHDVAADTIAQYPELAQRHLPRELLAFLDAVNLRAAAPDEAHAQLEQLGKQYIERMRLLAKMIQDARTASDSAVLSKKIQEYDAELEGYVPILMAQAHVYWQLGHYSDVLRVLHQNKEFASEHETWKLNVAHTHFMMDTPASKNEGAARDNFQQAIDHYAPIVGAAKARGKLLAVTAVVVANLCVAYIMNERNHEAEDLMKQLEREEELSGEAEPDKRVLHSCIVNLVIGTLYCAKQNYEFGISRVIKALEPLDQKLEADTWFYAKRCVLGLVDGLAKHMLFVNDKTVHEIVAFLEHVVELGGSMPAALDGASKRSRSIAYEAGLLKDALVESLEA